MPLPELVLKRREERRIRAGHPWIYSNEVDTGRTPLASFAAGDFANVHAFNGASLGTAYVNPHCLICARVVDARLDRPLDEDELGVRIDAALRLRERLFPEPCYRLVFGEGDGLPGLVVDRHAGVLVLQIGTAGMERLTGAVVDLLAERLAPDAIVLRNDGAGREVEGLRRNVEVVYGDVPEVVEIVENGARFRIRPLTGQKTGWFYDHRLNRARARAYVRDARVLDLFSYAGAWGVQAARAGAASVLCVDESPEALAHAAENAALNAVGDRVAIERADAFDALKDLHAARERFDVVIVDPPAFARRRRDLPAALEAYRRLNRMAMRVLADDGILLSASCSTHVEFGHLRDAIRAAGRRLGRRVQILEQGRQGPDHPVHAALPETEYLKWFAARAIA